MAAVLGCGYKPAQPAAMHPFFQTDSDSPNASRLQHNDTSIPNLDGAHGCIENNPLTRSTQMQRTSILQGDQSRDHDSEPIPHKHESSSTDLSNCPNTEADLTFHRRKRRRLSQEDDLYVIETGVKTDSDVKNDNAFLDTTSEIGIGPSEHSTFTEPSSPPHPALPPDTKTDMVLRSPRKSTPRKAQSRMDIAFDGNHDTLQMKPLNNSTPPSKRKKSTPRKKTLSVHANGKLMSSPTANGNPVPQINTNTVTKPVSSRNFKMKNGKFVQSLEISLRYGKDSIGRENVGRKIDAILVTSNGRDRVNNRNNDNKTHPFFLGKIKSRPQASELVSNQGDTTENDSESTSRQNEPVPWKDIKFKSLKPTTFKSLDSARPAWPPLSIQHVGKELPILHQNPSSDATLNEAKLKQRLVQLDDNEDILSGYMQHLNTNHPTAAQLAVPKRHYLTGAKVASDLAAQCGTSGLHDAIISIRNAVKFGSSAFDRGECAGPNMWSSQYAPTRSSEVLQPATSVLREWLQGLVIHNVKSGIDVGGSAKRQKGLMKKKKRKQKDEFDDFLVDSDEDLGFGKSVKTAILIVGPNGCGKTASVFAVARELGFEVFEIHPGMRRGAKDIFDKVGDMAHNHLVQNGPDLSRSSSVGIPDADVNIDTNSTNKQSNVTDFLGTKKAEKASIANMSSGRTKKEQKQSLILFEEVDLLFEDDRGFWSGVQSLIKHSKRPVVLTCNDSSSVPIHELDLHDVLTYNPIECELAVDYLQNLAAAEGHILEREPLSTLYATKSHDLRASITELNLWCQMTVGSRQGGLDWMVQDQQSCRARVQDGTRLRTFSQGTFQKSLDLMPQRFDDNEAIIKYNREALGIDAMEWCDFAQSAELADFGDGGDSKLRGLSRYSEITEARSAADVMDDDISPLFATVIGRLTHTSHLAADRDIVTLAYKRTYEEIRPHRQQLIDAFVPITTAKPTFPPSHICLAPSIAIFTSSVVTDIAPYVRCIVSLDKYLEERRDEIFGSQGKSRKTRAATAAAEGGDKASTRSERWFPKGLDFAKVLDTGGRWPQWYSTYNEELTACAHE